MAPDLNSLPPSRSPSGSPLQPRTHTSSAEGIYRRSGSPSPRSSSLSLAASASINAGFQNEDSRRSSSSTSQRNLPSLPIGRSSERQRASVSMNLSLNDPSLPGPGELHGREQSRPSVVYHHPAVSPHSLGGSPTLMAHHQRAPSLGELHQELEQEQEAQVNRLLEMIRQQQAQLQQMQLQSGSNTAVEAGDPLDDSTPTSERSFSFPNVPGPGPGPGPGPISVATSHPRSPGTLPLSIANPRPRSPAPRSSFDLSRRSSRRSRTPSHTGSPSLRPLSAGIHSHGGEEWLLSGGGSHGSRDESAFYQAETLMLTRENQMLRLRIRELERQINEANSATANTPATPSNLTAPPMEANIPAANSEGQEAEQENKD